MVQPIQFWWQFKFLMFAEDEKILFFSFSWFLINLSLHLSLSLSLSIYIYTCQCMCAMMKSCRWVCGSLRVLAVSIQFTCTTTTSTIFVWNNVNHTDGWVGGSFSLVLAAYDILYVWNNENQSSPVPLRYIRPWASLYPPSPLGFYHMVISGYLDHQSTQFRFSASELLLFVSVVLVLINALYGIPNCDDLVS